MYFLVNYYDENDERIEAVVEASSFVEAKKAVPSDRVNWVREATEEEAANAQQDDETGSPESQSADDQRQAATSGGDGPAPDHQTSGASESAGASPASGEAGEGMSRGGFDGLG